MTLNVCIDTIDAELYKSVCQAVRSWADGEDITVRFRPLKEMADVAVFLQVPVSEVAASDVEREVLGRQHRRLKHKYSPCDPSCRIVKTSGMADALVEHEVVNLLKTEVHRTDEDDSGTYFEDT